MYFRHTELKARIMVYACYQCDIHVDTENLTKCTVYTQVQREQSLYISIMCFEKGEIERAKRSKEIKAAQYQEHLQR